MTKPRLSVGILGCGHIAPTHVKAWRKAGRFRIAGVYDVQKDSAQKLSAALGAGVVFETSDDLISTCDVVDICTPPSTHSSLIEKAIGHQKHLVVEKPVVSDRSEWARLLEQLNGYSSTFTVIHHMKFIRAAQKAKQIIESGRLGRLLRIETYFATHVDTDRMLGDQPHWSHGLAGGRWFETLPHNLYLTHYLAGPLDFDRVTARSTNRAAQGVRADEIVVTLAGAETLGTIHFSANCRHNYRWAVLIGSEGVVRLDLLSGALAFDRVSDTRATRMAGRLFLNSLAALARAPVDRALVTKDRFLGWTPHARLVQQLELHLAGASARPTPFDEIRYTVENCFRIGAAIEDSLA